MLKRTISAIVALGILIFVLIQNNQLVFNIAVTTIAAIALWEFYGAVKKKGIHPISILGYISTILLLGIGFVSKDVLIVLVSLLFPLLLLCGYCVSIITNLKYNILDIATTLVGILYIPYLLSFIAYTKVMPHGDYLIWFIFAAAWITDTFAYFVGVAIGKHKFSKISPKKSIEGCIGGIVGCIAFFLIYAFFLNKNVEGIELNYMLIGILGFFASVVAQIGDFAASSIKRFCEIKDYSEIMPGHGGILDRFDSILIVSPLVYACLTLVNMGII